MIALYVFLIIVGLVLIFKAGDLLVDSSLKLCKLLGLSPLFVGAILVSLLTTIPELIITFVSVGRGFTGLAVGDAVGTIIFNTAVILGVGLTFGGLDKLSNKYSHKIMLLVLAAITVFVFAIFGTIKWYFGAILLLFYVVFTWINIKEVKKDASLKQREDIEGDALQETFEELSAEISNNETIDTATMIESKALDISNVKISKKLDEIEKTKNSEIDFSNNYEDLEKAIKKHEKIVEKKFQENIQEEKQSRKKENLKTILMFILSGALVAIGAVLLVEFGEKFAYALNISEDIVGLLILGVGSSLPELATGIQAIKKNTVELSIGNVIGANIINIALLIGGGAIVSKSGLPIAFETLVVSFPVMLVSILVLGLSLITKKKIAKKQGIILLSIYVLYFIFSLLNIFLKIV